MSVLRTKISATIINAFITKIQNGLLYEIQNLTLAYIILRCFTLPYLKGRVTSRYVSSPSGSSNFTLHYFTWITLPQFLHTLPYFTYFALPFFTLLTCLTLTYLKYFHFTLPYPNLLSYLTLIVTLPYKYNTRTLNSIFICNNIILQ